MAYYIISGEQSNKMVTRQIFWFRNEKNKAAAMRFLKLLLKGQVCTPLKVVTDKLVSYSAAKKN